jgi:hypothetical protein
MGLVLMTLCCGKYEALKRLRIGVASELDSVGALMFLVIAILGITSTLGGRFFTNYIAKSSPGEPYALFSAGTIILSNIAIALKVASSLFLVFILLVALKVIYREGEERPE